MRHVVSVFGVAQQGDLYRHIYLHSLSELLLQLGHPSKEGRALELAIQSLMFKRSVIFFRVQDEGFEEEAYLKGLHLLEKRDKHTLLSALAIPGVGDKKIIETAIALCKKERSFLIMNEKDFYDYATTLTQE